MDSGCCCCLLLLHRSLSPPPAETTKAHRVRPWLLLNSCWWSAQQTSTTPTKHRGCREADTTTTGGGKQAAQVSQQRSVSSTGTQGGRASGVWCVNVYYACRLGCRVPDHSSAVLAGVGSSISSCSAEAAGHIARSAPAPTASTRFGCGVRRCLQRKGPNLHQDQLPGHVSAVACVELRRDALQWQEPSLLLSPPAAAAAGTVHISTAPPHLQTPTPRQGHLRSCPGRRQHQMHSGRLPVRHQILLGLLLLPHPLRRPLTLLAQPHQGCPSCRLPVRLRRLPLLLLMAPHLLLLRGLWRWLHRACPSCRLLHCWPLPGY